MLSLLMGAAFISALHQTEQPMIWLRKFTGMWAGIRKGDDRKVIRLELALTLEEFDRIVAIPEVWQGIHEAQMHRQMGLVNACPTCGAANPAGDRG